VPGVEVKGVVWVPQISGGYDMTLQEKIRSGKFVVLGEFEPPKGADFSPLSKSANLTRGRLDAVVVPEMANAVLKASSLGGCAFLQREGVETVFQLCCRDRNRLALQADILSAAALGVRNLMAVPGEDIRFGDHPQARTVNDLDLVGLLETVQKLQSGKDLSGIELRGSARFCVGSTLDTGAPGGLLNIELENLKRKTDLGVEYVLTNPIFDLRRFEQFTRRIDIKPLAVIPTVLLLKSAGMARYIDRNIKGISIPAEIIRDIQKAPDKAKECVRIAAEIISRVREMGMAGVLISTVGWEDKLPLVLDEAKL
jgi:5,10-methylenetetrahydrofolate reductase